MTKTIEATWQLLQQHQGETFHTAKGLPFTYTIRGGELFVTTPPRVCRSPIRSAAANFS